MLIKVGGATKIFKDLKEEVCSKYLRNLVTII